jgi:hypothetical protein
MSSHELNTEEGGFIGPLLLAYNVSKLIPIRQKFSSTDQAFINRYGRYPINRMMVCRKPIPTYMNSVLNLITFKKWEKAVARYGYDKLFHLYLLIDILDQQTGKIIRCILEKNETVRCHEFKDNLKDTEFSLVEKKYAGNLFSLIGTTQAQMGKTFWTYDAFKNNCQDFILNVLGANDLLTDQLQKFIKQDVDSIAHEIPSYVSPFARAITDTASRFRTITGRGVNVPV